MSVPEETREQLPDPSELINNFRQAHQDVVTETLQALAAPSDKTLITAGTRMEVCKISLGTLKDNFFFAASGNPFLLKTSLREVIKSTEELIERIKTINPECGQFRAFKDGVQPWMEFCLTGDHKIDIGNEMREYVLGGNEVPSPDQAAETVHNVYLGVMDKLEETVLSSDSVSKFLNKREKKVKKADRKTSPLKYGGVALAAFIGTSLANRWQKRK